MAEKENFKGSDIVRVYPEFNEHILIRVKSEESGTKQNPFDDFDPNTKKWYKTKEFYLSIADLEVILSELDFTVEKKRTRSWVTKWKKRSKK